MTFTSDGSQMVELHFPNQEMNNSLLHTWVCQWSVLASCSKSGEWFQISEDIFTYLVLPYPNRHDELVIIVGSNNFTLVP